MATKRARREGSGVVEYILVVAIVIIVGSAVFERFSPVLTEQIVGLSLEVAGGSATSPCLVDNNSVYDPRADRYRDRDTGRFTPGC